MSDAITLSLVISSGIIVVGFLSNLLFERTGLPDMLILIFLGIVFGPILGIFDVSSVMGLAPYLAALAVVFILFDGGMRLNLYRVLADSPRASFLAILSFLFSLSVVSIFMFYVFNIPFLHAVLFGSICGGSSSVAVTSMVCKIKISKKCSTILSIESAITDTLCIVIALIVIDIIITGQLSLVLVGQNIAGKFSIGAVIGTIFGVLWLSILKRVAKASYAYMLTLAVVLFAYAFSEYFGGSGALCSLLFGMVLGNEKHIYQMLRIERPKNIVVDAGLKRFEAEIAFLIRSFFFVYLGLIATFNNFNVLVAGVIISLILLLARFIVVRVATLHSQLKKERQIMVYMLTRGLAAAVLATLPMQYALINQDFSDLAPLYINLTLGVVIFTAIIGSFGAFIYQRKIKKVEEGNSVTK